MSDKTTPKLAVVPSVGTGEDVKQWWCPQCGSVVVGSTAKGIPYCFQHGHPMTGTPMQEIQRGEPAPVPWDQPEKKPGTFGDFTPYPAMESSRFVSKDAASDPEITMRVMHKYTAKDGWRAEETSVTIRMTPMMGADYGILNNLLAKTMHDAGELAAAEAHRRNAEDAMDKANDNG